MWKINLIVLGILLGVIAPIPIAQVAPEAAESSTPEEKSRRLSITLQVNSGVSSRNGKNRTLRIRVSG